MTALLLLGILLIAVLAVLLATRKRPVARFSVRVS
jgi:hypothetical protein